MKQIKKFFKWVLDLFRPTQKAECEEPWKRKFCKSCSNYNACSVGVGHAINPMTPACSYYKHK